MKDQLKTIQTGLAIAIDAEGFVDKPVRRALLEARTALSELERMAGEPVSHATVAGALFDFMGWLTSRRARLVLSSVDDAAPAADAIKEFAAMRGLSINDAQVQTWKEQLATPPAQQPQYEAGDMASAHNDGFRAGVASVAQQPQARPDFNDEWTGYLKDGETPFERLMRERKDLGALTKLYQRAIEENERLKAQQPQAEVGNSEFDHKTAADFLSGKTVSDEAVRKFVQASRWAHDDRASLQSMLHSVRNELASREAEIALLKKELMEAEAAPQQAEGVPPTHVLVPVAVLQSIAQSSTDQHARGFAAGALRIVQMADAAPQQAEAGQYTRADIDRAYSAGLVEGERLAIQQAEAAPSDVVRGAAPIPGHELVTMYDERPTSDLEMIEFAREVERRHGIGVQPQHITDGSPCWCNPDVAYTDPETGASVIVHRRPQ